MAKIKLTAQELKKQREALKRFRRYLPTLVLKKLQIQIELNRARGELNDKIQREKSLREAVFDWIAVMGEEAGIGEQVRIESVETGALNVAGIEVPSFKRLRFQKTEYDLYTTPFWLDQGVKKMREILTAGAEIFILTGQVERLEKELRTTIQRVNLFEKIKIPEATKNIRKIQIFLGDQQTAAVVRGKISKGKVLRRSSVEDA